MNKKPLVFVGLVVFILAGFIIFFLAKSDNSNNKKDIFNDAAESDNSDNAKDFLKNEDAFFDNEKKITISLPFSKSEKLISIMPMGEVIAHPVAGHPGFDFFWSDNVAIIACADGIVADIQPDDYFKGHWNISIKSGDYFIKYTGMSSYDENLKIGMAVKKGDFLGRPHSKASLGKSNDYMIHWEMTPAYKYAERLCPMTYFDSESREIIERAWDNVAWENKKDSPELCNRIWKNLNSFADIKKWLESPEKVKYDEELKKYKESDPVQ